MPCYLAAPVFTNFGFEGTPEIHDSSTRFPKFVIRLRILANELRKAKGTSKLMILVPLSI
jgi:hypothetical protein